VVFACCAFFNLRWCERNAKQQLDQRAYSLDFDGQPNYFVRTTPPAARDTGGRAAPFEQGQHMFTSTTIRAALALPALSALLLTLSTAAMTAQAATVTSTVHFQRKITLNCSGILCSGNFPAPGTNRRLNVTRVTCTLQGPGGSTVKIGAIALMNASNVVLLPEYMPVIYSSSDGTHTLNQAVDMQIASTEHMQIILELVSGTPSGSLCTATGTLDTLQ
jgi:hypothetical protein